MADIFENPITLLGDLFEKLGDDEAIIAEYPDGYKRYLCKRSHLDKLDAAWPIVWPWKYDWVSKTFHVKIAKYKPGLCEGFEGSIEVSKNEIITIKPAGDSHYGLDPIGDIMKKELYKIWYGGMNLKIKKVILSGPATIIFWDDGTKTVVKCENQDEIDNEKGILYAALKKLATKKEYDNILRAIDKEDEACKDEHVAEERKHPSDQKCPYCGANWNMTIQRAKLLQMMGTIKITCGKCLKTFNVCFNDDKNEYDCNKEVEK